MRSRSNSSQAMFLQEVEFAIMEREKQTLSLSVDSELSDTTLHFKRAVSADLFHRRHQQNEADDDVQEILSFTGLFSTRLFRTSAA
jgi:hypothetical protein